MMRRSSQIVALLLLLLARSLVVLGKEPIQVVFAGLPRSGTKSVSQALTRLGYHTCHAMDLVPPSGMTEGGRGILEAFAEDRIDDALRLTEEENCNATFDIHLWYWREIRQKRPNAKFLVVIRDYDRWEASMQHVISVLQPMLRYPLRKLPVFDLTARFMSAAAQHSMSVGPDYATDYFKHPTSETYIKDRKRMYDQLVTDGLDFVKTEPNRALLFNLKDGYAPLCKFLGIDKEECPDEDFPRANSGRELTISVAVFMMIELSFFAIPLLFVFVVVRKWWWKAAAGSVSASAEKKSK